VGAQLLLVEDSPTQAARVLHILKARGYQVAWANSGAAALERCRESLPELIVSDVTMPEMDGYQLCQAIKGDVALTMVPVLLVTGLADPEDIIKGLEAGADGYLAKPYDDQDLFDRIEFVLANPAPPEASEPIEVTFLGKARTISASRQQMLNLLLSTYEGAALQNRRLQKRELEMKMEIRSLKLELEDLQAEGPPTSVVAVPPRAGRFRLADLDLSVQLKGKAASASVTVQAEALVSLCKRFGGKVRGTAVVADGRAYLRFSKPKLEGLQLTAFQACGAEASLEDGELLISLEASGPNSFTF
jgi:DNA-binding response OmpR family regulator